MTDHLVSPSEIAELYGVGRACVSNWQKRDIGFPKPVHDRGGVRLFDVNEVAAWMSDRNALAVSSLEDRIARKRVELDRLERMMQSRS